MDEPFSDEEIERKRTFIRTIEEILGCPQPWDESERRWLATIDVLRADLHRIGGWFAANDGGGWCRCFELEEGQCAPCTALQYWDRRMTSVEEG